MGGCHKMPGIDITKNYIRLRQKSPSYFDKSSLRTIDPGKRGHLKLVIGCKVGKYDKKKQRCKRGTEIQTVILKKKDFTKKQLEKEIKKLRKK